VLRMNRQILFEGSWLKVLVWRTEDREFSKHITSLEHNLIETCSLLFLQLVRSNLMKHDRNSEYDTVKKGGMGSSAGVLGGSKTFITAHCRDKVRL
jgi:hypothetical protein